MEWPWRSPAANAMDVAAGDRHDFAWRACSRLVPVLLRDRNAPPTSTQPMDASHASMEEIGERGFAANWLSPPLEPSRAGGTAVMVDFV